MRFARPMTFLILILLVAACAVKPLNGKKPPTVILISLDTLSAGHMDLYGYKRPTMPFLKRLGEESVVFENFFSSAAYTLPSHFSMFTGVSPQSHGMVIDDYNRNLTTRRLSSQFRTMAEYFKLAGYKTYWSAPLNDPHLDFESGIHRGFEVVERSFLDSMVFQISDSSEIEFRRMLHEAAQQPSFLFLHTYSAHDPYKPVEPFHKMFAPGKRFPLETYKDFLGDVMKNVFESKAWVDTVHLRWIAQFNLPDPRGAKRMSDLYDGGLRTLDEKLEVLFRMLKEENLYDNSIIIVTSDHGEAFGQHGQFSHNTPYLDLLRVPLIVKMPGAKAKRVGEPSYGVDLLPTVLDLAGLSPQSNVEGESLEPLIFGKTLNRKNHRWFALGFGNQTILDPNWQLLRWDDQRAELFDRVKDPEGIKNVAGEHPAQVERLEAELSAFESSRKPPDQRAPLSRPAKLYWFSIEGLRADKSKYPVHKWAVQGHMPHIRLMLERGLSGFSKIGSSTVDFVSAIPQARVFEIDASNENASSITERFENERLNIDARLDKESRAVTGVRIKLSPFAAVDDVETVYRGIDRILSVAFRRRSDNTYVVLTGSGAVQGPFLVWGPQVRQGRQIKGPVSSVDRLNYVLRLIGAQDKAKISDAELSGAIEFVR